MMKRLREDEWIGGGVGEAGGEVSVELVNYYNTPSQKKSPPSKRMKGI